ncbi:uncharacterized protein LOC100830653 [Brachypodium distachyon]|nr:uncharacterized protein LOC100830653 [Brachypodium distachyon]|eukprot:XP_003575509.1 uncharacterized protein LOC100830653 [Brachypodium distachyon]
MMDPGEGSSTGVRKCSSSQYSMEWPSDSFFEKPRPVHVDWPMNSQFDLNLDLPMESQLDLDRDYNFHGSEFEAFDLNEDIGCDDYFSDDSECADVNVDGLIELEPEIFPASDDGSEDGVENVHEVSKAEGSKRGRI